MTKTDVYDVTCDELRQRHGNTKKRIFKGIFRCGSVFFYSTLGPLIHLKPAKFSKMYQLFRTIYIRIYLYTHIHISLNYIRTKTYVRNCIIYPVIPVNNQLFNLFVNLHVFTIVLPI